MNLAQSIVVSAAGRPMFGVGGMNAHATHEFKGYVVSLEWDDSDGEPLLLVWSATGGRNAGVFGICLSSAGKYVEPDGRPTDEGLLQMGLALPVLGRASHAIELNNLADVVMRYIPDLLRMPPAPKEVRRETKGRAAWDIETRNPSGLKAGEVSI